MTNKPLQRRHLETLVAVAANQSVHSAARALGMPQPAVSRLLAEAERLLAVRVFDRSSQGSQPTPHGQMLLAQARFLLRGLDRLGQAAARDRPAINLGSIPRGMHSLVPRLLERLYPAQPAASVGTPAGVSVSHAADASAGASTGGRAGPPAKPLAAAPPAPEALRFRLTEGSSTVLLQALAKGSLDFAILGSSSDAAIDSKLAVERLYDERTVVVCAAGHAEIPDGPVRFGRLAENDWVLPAPETASRAAFDQFCRRNASAPIRPVIEARSFESSLALVERTRFLSIAPESIARRHAALGTIRMLRIRQALPASSISLAYARLAQADPVLDAFRHLVHAVAAEARAALRRKSS